MIFDGINMCLVYILATAGLRFLQLKYESLFVDELTDDLLVNKIRFLKIYSMILNGIMIS